MVGCVVNDDDGNSLEWGETDRVRLKKHSGAKHVDRTVAWIRYSYSQSGII